MCIVFCCGQVEEWLLTATDVVSYCLFAYFFGTLPGWPVQNCKPPVHMLTSEAKTDPMLTAFF